MTERARRAAAELERRGWVVFAGEGKRCGRCHTQTGHGDTYCYRCGERLSSPDAVVDGYGALDDLDAAIAAALESDR